MDAAERLFIKNGIAATSVDEIVAAADVSKGTFYHYFESKEHMLAALQERFIASMAERFQTAMSHYRTDDWASRLRSWVSTGINSYLDRVALHDVVFHEYRAQDRKLRNENAIVTSLADFLHRGAQSAAWTIDDPRLTAIVLFSALHAAVDDAVILSDKIDRKKLVRALERIFERIVGVT